MSLTTSSVNRGKNGLTDGIFDEATQVEQQLTPQSTKEKFDAKVLVAMTPTMKKQIDNYAKAHFMKTSELMRQAAIAYMNNNR